jgi:hypothetical protein
MDMELRCKDCYLGWKDTKEFDTKRGLVIIPIIYCTLKHKQVRLNHKCDMKR